MKKLISLFITLVATLVFAEAKFAMVDVQKAIEKTKEGQKVKEKLEKEYNEKKKQLQTKETDFKKMQEDLEKKKSILTEEVKMKKDNELKEEWMKLQELLQQSRMTFESRQRELMQPVLEKMQKAIEKVAKENSYSMIFQKAEHNIVYGDPKLDVTEQVAKAFETVK